MSVFSKIIKSKCPSTIHKHIKFAERGLYYLYQNPQREYHNFSHIERSLQELDKAQISEMVEHQDLISLSILYHDCIYDPRKKDNEQLSAERAFIDLKGLGFYDSYAQLVYDHIMLTTHEKPCNYLSGQILMDIDMSILGLDPESFLCYEGQIRREYSFVPTSTYNIKRTQFLLSILKKDFIFQTIYFREKYEETARKNIETAENILATM